MNGLDSFIIEGAKELFLKLPGWNGTSNLISANLGVSVLPFLGLLVVGEIVVIYIKSESFQKKWGKSKHQDIISNVLMASGIITMVVVLL